MMTSPLQLKPLEKSELVEYGLAQVQDAAFEAVLTLWRRRQSEGWTQKRLAENIDRDKGTVSKYFRGPSNWTFKTLGELVQGLRGDVRIVIDALEDDVSNGSNYDAYDDLSNRADAKYLGVYRYTSSGLIQDQPQSRDVLKSSKWQLA